MHRTRSALYQALIAGLNLLLTALISLVLSRMILVHLGSEYNGLNAIVVQFLMVVTLVEGGFTTASLVALFAPFQEHDIVRINNLFAETSHKFKKICLMSSVVGAFTATVYGFFLQSTIPYATVVAVLLLGLLNSMINIGIVTKHRLIFQAAQSEYVISAITLISNVVTRVCMIIILVYTKSIILVLSFQAVMTFITSIIIKLVFSRRYPFISKQQWDKQKRIQGTKDVLIGKVIGTVHSSSAVIFLSLFSNAAITSVYAVYYSVINLATSFISIFISAPQNALGQILQGNDTEKSKNIVSEFEYIVILLLTILFIPLYAALIPFVRIYTAGVFDVEYTNYLLRTIMCFSVYFQLIHVPCGLCIYMAGRYKAAKRIQTIALSVLLLCNTVFGLLWGMYGVLISILICNVLLAIMEIGYVHLRLFKRNLPDFFKQWLPNTLLLMVLAPIFEFVMPNVTSYVDLLFWVAIEFILATAIVLLVNWLLLPQSLHKLVMRVRILLKRKRV